MERVQGHLCRRFSDRLRSSGTAAFAWMCQRMEILGIDELEKRTFADFFIIKILSKLLEFLQRFFADSAEVVTRAEFIENRFILVRFFDKIFHGFRV